MHSIVWLAATLFAALLYGLRIRARVGYVTRSLMSWQSAVAMASALAISSLAAARGYLDITHDAGVGLQAITMFMAAWLGLRYWVSMSGWDPIAGGLALALVYGSLSAPGCVSGLLLVCAALGVSVGGYYATKAWLRVLFMILCAYDVYAVWLSDTMETLMRRHPESGLSMVLFSQMEIGTLDVVLAALAVVGIQRHRGMLRAFLFSVLSLIAVPTMAVLAERNPEIFARVPYLVVLAPLVIAFLSGRKAMRPNLACS
jgi:hypothetical protein